LQLPFLGKAAWLWLVFVGIVVLLLAFDLGILHRDDHEIGVRESRRLHQHLDAVWRLGVVVTPFISLDVIFVLLAGGVAVSLCKTRGEQLAPEKA